MLRPSRAARGTLIRPGARRVDRQQTNPKTFDPAHQGRQIMFEKRSERGFQPALPGIERKTLVHGHKTLMTEFRMAQGSVLPLHAHPHEQTGYLIKGRIVLSIGNETREAQAGDSWCVPGGVEHGAEILEDSIAIEVFSPLREDYLPGPDLA